MKNSGYNFDNYSSRTSVTKNPRNRRAASARRVPSGGARVKNIRTTNRKKNGFFSKLLLIFLAAVIIFLIGVVGFNMYRGYKRSLHFTYSDGVNVSGIDIGGLYEKDARVRLKEKALDAVKDIAVKIKVKDKEYVLSKADFKYKFDFETPLKAAKTYSMKEQGIYKTKKGATLPATTFAPGSNEFTLNYKVKKASVKAQVKKIAKPYEIKVKHSRVKKFYPFSENRFEFESGSDGRAIDKKGITKKIINLFSSKYSELNIEAEVKTVKHVTSDELKKRIVGLSTATNVSRNTENGTHNMAVALDACNGSVIEPGATWSFNKCTGDSNLESNGYRKAAVISKKKVEQGIGGGICQASTIIFEAGLFANMDIVERHNHYWASQYAYAGEDATIDYPDLDLKMRNRTNYQMFIESRMEDGYRLRVNVWGYQDPSYDNIRLHSENYEINDDSYHTRTFRELFKNGKIIKTEIICNSTYNTKYSIKIADGETFRTSVNGNIKYEDEDYTPMEIVDNRTKKDDSGDNDSDESSDSDQENEEETEDGRNEEEGGFEENIESE